MLNPDDDPGGPENHPEADRPPTTELSASSNTPKPIRLVQSTWDPKPIRPPEIDHDLPTLPWPERAAEAIRFATLSAEHWISRQGILREWLRLNFWIGIALLALALLVVPPVTMLLEGTAQWSHLVKSTALNITATIAGLPPVIIAIATCFITYKLLRRSWLRRRSQRRYHDPNEPYSMQ